MMAAKKNCRNQTANHSAIDGKSAFPYFEDGKSITGITIPLKYDIVSSGADNGNGQCKKNKIKYQILLETLSFSTVYKPATHLKPCQWR